MNEKLDQTDTEISLVDLFAVLLRYRKLIIGITLFAVILAVAGYFFYPSYQYNKVLKNPQTTMGRALFTVKPMVRGYVPYTLETFFNNAEVVLDALREAGMDTFEYGRDRAVSLVDETERTQALSMINQRYIKNMNLSGKEYGSRIFQIITNTTKDVTTVVRDIYTIEVVFSHADYALVEAFLQRLFVRGNAGVEDYVRPVAESLVSNYERLLNDRNASEAVRQALERDFQVYSFLRDFLAGKETLLSEIGAPVLTQPEVFLSVYKDRYKMRGIIIMFAGLFLSVFLAFAFNAIRSIKNDAEAMSKIHDALGRPAGNNE